MHIRGVSLPPQQPAEGQRWTEPAEVESGVLMAMQLAPQQSGPRRTELPERDPPPSLGIPRGAVVRQVPERETNSLRFLNIDELFRKWMTFLWNSRLRFQAANIPDLTSWNSVYNWLWNMRERIPASILYVGLFRNLGVFKAWIAVSGVVGRHTYKIQDLSVFQNTTVRELDVPPNLIKPLSELFGGTAGTTFLSQLTVTIKQKEIAEDGSWARVLLEYKFQTSGVLGRADASAFQLVRVRVDENGFLKWEFHDFAFV